MKQQSPTGSPPEFPEFKDNYVESPRVHTVVDLVGEIGGIESYFFRMVSPASSEIFQDWSAGIYDNRANRRFLARAYKQANRKSDHVVVMYNGLDETIYSLRTIEQLYSFYDEIGARLASAGMLAIMLPTPYHMNRAMAYRSASDGNTLRKRLGPRFLELHRPSEAWVNHPANVYGNHFQGFKETLELCRCFKPELVARAYPDIEHDPATLEPRIVELLQLWTTSSPNISLLGYSLGGLRALTEFLADRNVPGDQSREPLFTACVAVCSGGSLSDLKAPTWIDSSKWDAMIKDLNVNAFSTVAELAHRQFPRETDVALRYYGMLQDMFLGNAKTALTNDPASTTRNVLFVLGGADTLVPPESVQRINPKGGVNILQVANLPHLFAYDLAWNTTKGVICDVISMFLLNSSEIRVVPDPVVLVEMVVALDLRLSLLRYREHVGSDALARVKDSLPERCIPLLWGASGYDGVEGTEGQPQEIVEGAFALFTRELLDDFDLAIKRRIVNPATYWPEWEKRFLGGTLSRNNTLRLSARKLAIAKTESLLDALKREELLGAKHLPGLLDDQERDLRPILARLGREFRAYLRRRRIASPQQDLG